MTRAGQVSLGLAALLLVLAAFAVPGDAGITGTNLDDSYSLVIEDAASRGAVFGTDIIYTHGPLGYLFQPQGLGGFRAQRLLYGALRAVFVAYVCCALLVRIPLPMRAVLFIWFLASPPSPTVLYAGVAVVLLHPPALPWLRRVDLSILPAVCGLCAMVKFTELVSGIVVTGGVAVVFAYQKRWREAVLPVAIFAMTALGVWLAAGQPLGGLADYLWTSWDMANGFSTMAIAPAPGMLAWGLAGVTVLVVGAALAAFTAPRRLERTLVLLPVMASAFLDWKHGFVRADNHVLNFFAPLGVYAAMLFVGVDRRRWWHPTIVALALAIGVGGMKLAGTKVSEMVHGLVTLAASPFAFPGTKARAAEEAQAEKQRQIHEQAALPAVKAAVGRASVDIFNYGQAYAYLNDLHLGHRPVFQSFAAYTPRLQRINFDFYQSSRRPALVLFRLESTDGRWPWLDDAPLSLHLLTDWEPIERERGFLLMTRGSGVPRGEWRELTSGQSKWGERIAVPAHPVGSLVAITLDENPRGAWGRLKRFLYQGANLRLSLHTRRETKLGYNFVPEMATERVLLSPCLESVDEMLAWQTGAMAPRQLVEFSLAPWAGHENEFLRELRYRLWLWSPSAAQPDPAVAQRGPALMYPYLPTVPESILPALETIFVDAAEFGVNRAPCRIEMLVPPGTPGMEGRAVVTRTRPGIGEVLVRVQLKDGKGNLLKEGSVRPGLTATETVQINFEFDRKWVTDGRCRIVLEAVVLGESEASADQFRNRPRIIWGPFQWKKGG